MFGAIAVGPAGAAPVQGFGPVGSFGAAGSGPGDLSSPQHVAVDDATGNVLVADPGNGRVEVFQPDGSGSATYLTEFGSAAVSQPYGVAVDQSTGDVYVSGNDGVAPKIARFTSDNQPTPTYTLDGTFTSPVAGAGAGQIGDFNSPIAVDPATHDLIVADRGNLRIDRFSSTGTFLRASTAAGVPGGFTNLTDVAATGTNVYVTDIVSDVTFSGSGASRVLRFTAQGAYDATIAKNDTPFLNAIDSATGNLVTVDNARYDTTTRLNVYRGSTLSASTDFAPGAIGSRVTGVAVGGGANRHVYVVTDFYFCCQGGVSVQTFDPSPAVEAVDVVSTDSRSVDLAGLVNPEGNQTNAHFEYFDGSSWIPTTPDTVLNGTTDQAVTAHVTGLIPHTRYQFRVVATDTRTTAVSIPATALTADEAPTVVTGGSSSLTTSTASVQGSVTPLGVQSTYYFEYGTSTGYGQRSPAGAPEVAGNGFTARAVSADLRGLTPGTTYHYRLVATNSAGTSYGADRTFGTASSDVKRGYEMVSPAQKSGVPVDAYFGGFKARTDGDGIVFTTQKAAYDDGSSAGYQPRVLGTRTGAGWTSAAIDPPMSTATAGQDTFGGVLAVSDDLDRALIITTVKLGAQGVTGNSNLYIHNLKDDTYELVVTSSGTALYDQLAGVGGGAHYFGGTPDLSTIAIDVQVPLVAGAPGGGAYNVYTWSKATGLQLASVMPDGTPATSTATSNSFTRDAHRVSADGSRVFFLTGDGLFVRAHGTTVAASASQRTGDAAVPNPAAYLGASPDGRYVMFSTPGTNPLTDDAPATSNNAYRFDVETHRLTFLAPNVLSDTYPLPRPETGDMYYLSFFDPNGNSTAPNTNLYYEHGGQSVLVAASVSAPTSFAASPSGRYFAFQTTSRLMSYDNGGRNEVYLYDAAQGALTCPSCRTDGGAAGGDAQLGQADRIQLDYTPRALHDDGTLYFDSPDPLVPRDTNGQRDVYESKGGMLSLISPGTGKAAATFVDATPDGSDVFFVTDEQLVGIDHDATADLYDARVGGGIAAQNPEAGVAPCAGSECHEPVAGPTTSDAAPTMTSTQTPGKPATTRKPRLALVRSSVGKTSIKITVTTSSRGRIRASGATVKATSHNATKAGSYTLTVPLTQKTRTARRKGHRVKLSVRVALTAPFASPVSIKLTRTVGK